MKRRSSHADSARGRGGRPSPVRRAPQRSNRATGSDGGDWLTGLHSVEEALRAGRRRVERLCLRDGARSPELDRVAELARARKISVELVDEATFEEICGPELRSQGLALRAGALPELALEALLARTGPPVVTGGQESVHVAGQGPARRLVVLDGVEDPQNVGAIARVAESAGCLGLVLGEHRSAPLSPAVSRASAGAIEWLPVARVPNLSRGLEALKEAGFWILAAAPGEGSECLYDLDDRVLTGDLVVVLGAEGRGIRPSVLAQADHRIRIPMLGQVASLNVSTAGAVILYELLRRALPDSA